MLAGLECQPIQNETLIKVENLYVDATKLYVPSEQAVNLVCNLPGTILGNPLITQCGFGICVTHRLPYGFSTLATGNQVGRVSGS